MAHLKGFKDNPPLKGKDAKRFIEKMIEADNFVPTKESRAAYSRAKKVYDTIMAKEKIDYEVHAIKAPRPKDQQIYFVTCIRTEANKKYKGGPEHRCWGYYFEYKDAERAVLENVTDICENGYYDYCVIEKVPEGVCPIHMTEVQWFIWGSITSFNSKKEKTRKYSYRICDKPDFSNKSRCWSIG